MISAPLSLLVLYKLPLATAGLKKKSVPNFASKFPYHVILRRFIKYLLQRVIEPFLCLIYIILISNTEFLNRDVTPPTSQYLTWQFNTTKLCSIIYYGQNFRPLLVNPLIFHTKMSNHLLVQCNACLTWGFVLPFIVTCRPSLLIILQLFSVNLTFRNPEIPSCNIHIHSPLCALFQRRCPCLLHFKCHSTLHFHGEVLLAPDTTSFLKNQPVSDTRDYMFSTCRGCHPCYYALLSNRILWMWWQPPT